MYTKETLANINSRYIHAGHHILTDGDVNMANKYVDLIEKSRSDTVPKAGDRVIYTTDFGYYYRYAHIEDIREGKANICERPYMPFIRENGNEISCCTSGGAWNFVDVTKLKYIGREKKMFCDWGCFGACADGAVDFEAEVSVWEYISENPMFVDEKGNQYTTKDYDYAMIYYTTEKNPQYKYFANGMAWKNENDLQVWLKTFKGKVFKHDSLFGTALVWYYKEKIHHVSPKEYDKINGFEDSMFCNGLRRCKRIYDEENHIVNTYFVWYWDAPEMGDWKEQLTKQNVIRKRYELHWSVGENMYYKDKLKIEGTWYDLDWMKGGKKKC